MKKVVSLYIPILVGFVFLIGCHQTPEKYFENGVSYELSKQRDNNIENIRYILNLEIPEAKDQEIKGKIDIQLDYVDKKNPLIIDFREDSDHVVSVSKKGKEINYEFRNNHIIIPAKEFNGKEDIISIEFIAGDLSLNRNDEYLYTLFVPDRASTAFPCFDQPSLKAKYTLSLTIPKDWEAKTNSPIVAEEEKEKQRKIQFKESAPISTYLFSFVAGKFESVSRTKNGRTINAFHRSEDSVKLNKNIDILFDLHFNSINWLEKYTDVPYPFEQFDFVIVPSFQYGGMEHPGAILYRESRLLLSESATLNDELARANLIAHETAHIWFGDLVTMPWFNEVWLKEVFANFMAGKIIEPEYPEINHQLNFLTSHYPASYSVDRTKGANPIQQKLDNMLNAGTLYGSIIYHKAPIVMQHLEIQVGEEILQNSIQEYVKKYSYGNASWANLIEIIDTKTEKDLKQWSKVWVEEPGMPHIAVHPSFGVNKSLESVVLEQSDPFKAGRLWGQEVSVLLQTSDEVKDFTVFYEDTLLAIPEVRSNKEYSYIFPNKNGLAYGYFKLDNQSKAYLLNELNSINDPLLRASVYICLYENFLNKNINVDNYVSFLQKSIKNEKNEQNINLITGQFRTVFWKFLVVDKRNKIAEEAEQLFWHKLNSAKTNKTKSVYYNSYLSVASTGEAIENLYTTWDQELSPNGLSLSENDFIKLAFKLQLFKHSKSKEIYSQQYERITNQEKKDRFEFISPFCSSDISIRDEAFNSLKDEKNREKEPWVNTALYYLHHRINSYESIKYIRPSLDLLEEIQQTGDIFFPKRWLDATFSGHGSIDAVMEINLFLNENPDYPEALKNKILQSTDLVFRAALIEEE